MISLNGHETRLLRRGTTGPVVLFLHGFPEHAGGWADVMAELDGFQCFAPDQRGYGWSFRPDQVADYQTGHMVRDALDLIGTLGLDRVHVVGHDWGAAVAYGIAFTGDPRVASLTIANGVHPVPFQRELAKGGAQSEASRYMTWLRGPDSHTALAANDFEKLVAFLTKGMEMAWFTPEVQAEYKRVWQNADVVNAMVNWYRASPLVVAEPGVPAAQADLPALPHDRMKVRVPHMLIWGLGDKALLPETHDGLETFCDHLEIHEFADADHWITHQKPTEIAGLIRDFTARFP